MLKAGQARAKKHVTIRDEDGKTHSPSDDGSTTLHAAATRKTSPLPQEGVRLRRSSLELSTPAAAAARRASKTKTPSLEVAAANAKVAAAAATIAAGAPTPPT